MSANSVDAKASVGLANSLSNVFKLVGQRAPLAPPPSFPPSPVCCLCVTS